MPFAPQPHPCEVCGQPAYYGLCYDCNTESLLMWFIHQVKECAAEAPPSGGQTRDWAYLN